MNKEANSDYRNSEDSEDIKYNVIYSGRRSLAISILPDASVIVRVPYKTSGKTISRLVREKASWIKKHRDNYVRNITKNSNKYLDGEKHLFRGTYSVLKIERSQKPYFRFFNGDIELGLKDPNDSTAVKQLLYIGYKSEAGMYFSGTMDRVLNKFGNLGFKPSGLVIRTMKSRWGSCSRKGLITLNTELIKLPDQYLEYVIIHELCHLIHHNHGPLFYKLLSQLCPDYKELRKGLRNHLR